MLNIYPSSGNDDIRYTIGDMRSIIRNLSSVICVILFLLFPGISICQQTVADSILIRRIYTEALSNPVAYHNLDQRAYGAMQAARYGADSLSAWLKSDPGLNLFIRTSCILHPESESYNIIAEIKGSEHPEEIIAFGGHLDSWDIGEGAHDDGAGVVQTIEVLRLFKALGIKPKHTIRVVVFMDEEYAQRGASAYATSVTLAMDQVSGSRHIAAIESDRGGFTPSGT